MIIETEDAVYDLATSTKFSIIKSEYTPGARLLQISHPIGNPIVKRYIPDDADWNIIKTRIITCIKSGMTIRLDELLK